MPYDPNRHHRQSLRLPGYNYAHPGAYFVTICAWSRGEHFGVVDAEGVHHNTAGQMVAHWWEEVGRKFPCVTLDVFVVMPDHIHGLIMLGDTPPAQEEQMAVALGQIVRWFKTMSTNAYIRGVNMQGWPAFSGKLWQRNYHEHVIRDDADMDRVRAYIATNPARWYSRRAS